jgi:hypothetical protein
LVLKSFFQVYFHSVVQITCFYFVFQFILSSYSNFVLITVHFTVTLSLSPSILLWSHPLNFLFQLLYFLVLFHLILYIFNFFLASISLPALSISLLITFHLL